MDMRFARENPLPASGESKAVVAGLEARGLQVTAAQPERAITCADLE
jgi:hypothetical protein